jgi:hypothetical protein
MSVDKIGSSGTVNAASERIANADKKIDNADFADVLKKSMNKSGTDLDSIFEAASQKYNVPVNLLKAVGKAESNFNSHATSSCGAMGIMQLMPATAKSLGVIDAYNPEQNIMGGAKYLNQMLKQFKGNTELAVAAYNAGAGNVNKYNGIPPFKETQNYVAKVMGYCNNDITAGSMPAATVAPVDLSSDQQIAANDFSQDDLMLMLLLGKQQKQILEVMGGEEEDSTV